MPPPPLSPQAIKVIRKTDPSLFLAGKLGIPPVQHRSAAAMKKHIKAVGRHFHRKGKTLLRQMIGN